jgi:hypothetical protein
MYAQISNTTSSQSAIQSYFVGGGWAFQRRHPQAWAAVRAVAFIWFITLGSFLCSHGYEWGALVYIAAARELVFGYRLLKTSQARQH